jgi:hypothetical protein
VREKVGTAPLRLRVGYTPIGFSGGARFSPGAKNSPSSLREARIKAAIRRLQYAKGKR